MQIDKISLFSSQEKETLDLQSNKTSVAIATAKLYGLDFATVSPKYTRIGVPFFTRSPGFGI
jgi:hypothetical protein